MRDVLREICLFLGTVVLTAVTITVLALVVALLRAIWELSDDYIHFRRGLYVLGWRVCTHQQFQGILTDSETLRGSTDWVYRWHWEVPNCRLHLFWSSRNAVGRYFSR